MTGPHTEEEKQRIAHNKTQAALQRWRDQGGNPLQNRESRTAINWTLRSKGIPAKACSKCFTIKALTAYHRFASSADGLRSYCRECHSLTHANRSATDPAYLKKHRESAVAYYHANAPARREYSRKHQRRVHMANLEKNANRVQDPNALKRCAGQCGRTLPETSFRLDRGKSDGLRMKCRDCADSSREARRACAEAYGSPVGLQCYLCMKVFRNQTKVQADHLRPVSAGGPDEASNLWWTHKFCNTARGRRPLTSEEWGRVRSLQRQATNTARSIDKEMAS